MVVGERRVVGEAAVGALDARAHLVRGLARVGQHELPAGADAEAGEAMEPLDDDPRLAASRAGKHEARTVAVVDGDALLVVERRLRVGRRRG